MATITLPENYGFVILTVASYIGLNLWQVTVVGGKRKKAKILFPQAYAEKAQQDASKEAFIFNCAQRAHANTLEHFPSVLFSTLFFGLRYPNLATAVGAGWTVGRFLYTLGYTSGNPQNRNRWGFLTTPSTLVLHGGMAWSAAELVLGMW